MGNDNVRDALAALYRQNGALEAEAVVDAAKPKDHPLHDRFEWDNKKASHEYRLIQARHLIREVRVININDKDQPLIHVPASSVKRVSEGEGEEAKRARGGQYLVADVLSADEYAYRRALESARRDLDAAERRVQEIMDLRPQENTERWSVALRSIEAAKLALAA